MSAEKYYHQFATKMNDDQFTQIQDYYQKWDGQDVIDIKFRFIKIFGINRGTGKSQWYFLHDLLNIRRFKTNELPNYINEIISDYSIYPIRMFHSCTEWLAPNEIMKSDAARIIRSGIFPLENDTDLTTSIQVACELNSIIDNLRFVYSGNKSIHSWLEFCIDDLGNDDLIYADRREEAERTYRTKYFKEIQRKINHPLDRRISTDPRRVVPIINSLNGITMRKVVELPPEKICEYDETSVCSKASI